MNAEDGSWVFLEDFGVPFYLPGLSMLTALEDHGTPRSAPNQPFLKDVKIL